MAMPQDNVTEHCISLSRQCIQGFTKILGQKFIVILQLK